MSPAAEEVVSEAPVVSDIEDKKADIERRNILLKKANLDKAPEFAKKAIIKTVEAIDEDTRLKVIEKAYAGITATPISKELNLTTEQVRSIRTYYGVPDISDKIEYENWKKSIDAELTAVEKDIEITEKNVNFVSEVVTEQSIYEALKNANNC